MVEVPELILDCESEFLVVGGPEFSEPGHKLFTFHSGLGEFEVVRSHVEVVFLDHLVAEGFPRAVLWVLRDNPRARGFYERAGWTPTGRDEWFTGVYGRTLPEPLAEVEYGRSLR